jgi:hypothetical protein
MLLKSRFLPQEASVIGQIISHYRILEKPRQKDGGQVGEGGMSQNHPRAFFASGRDFEDPPFLLAEA